MFDYREYVNAHSAEYGSCPFWSWNDQLEAEELKRQIDDMRQSGMAGFFMHARGGLQTKYFSEEWFAAIETCVNYARERHMQAWLYDENGWPSGFANRELLHDPRNWACYLKMERSTDFPDTVVDDAYSTGVLAVYSMCDGKPIRLTVANRSQEYFCITRHFERSYVDTLNKGITHQFLSHVYEEYKSRFPNDLGTAYMPGFFTDEPQYFRYATPYSSVLPQAFREKYGYDVLEALPALFLDYEGACEKRYDYWSLLHELFIENWIKPVYEWCEKNHCKLTGHAIEESALFAQMWCCGGVMPFYEYEHIPGVDHLGRNIDPGLEAKQIGSAAAQLGKKRVLAEIFACTGCDTSPKELKGIGDSLYVEGINLICQHLYPYSSRGERKYDHPVHFSELLPWNQYMCEVNMYYNKLGCLLSLGTDITNILVLHPMHSAYLYYQRENDRNSIATLETAFMSCLNQLWSEQLLFHLGDETLIKKYGSVQGSHFIIENCRYDTVIMPDMDAIDSATAQLLERYLENGGKLLCFGRTPRYKDGRKCSVTYVSNTNLYEIIASQRLRVEYHGERRSMLKYAARSHEGNTVLFLTNLTDQPMHHITVAGLTSPRRWELVDDAFYAIPTSNGQIDINLAPYESCVMIDGDCVSAQTAPSKTYTGEMKLNNLFQLETAVENYLVLDTARVSFDGMNYSDKKPLSLISQELLEMRRDGVVWLQFAYHISGTPKELHLIVEPQQYREIAVNGKRLLEKENMWRIDRRFSVYDVSGQAKLGDNTVELCVDYHQNDDIYKIYFGSGTESLRNCMSFDTEISPIYIMGDFELQSEGMDFWQEDNAICHTGDFSIQWQNNTVHADNLTRAGYPFFYGKMRLRQIFTANAKTKAIRVEGKYGVCEVWINGCKAGVCLFENEVDISQYVREGENELTLVLYSSTRNLIGPFHYKDAEPASVFPNMFKFENGWHNGMCKQFAERYALVRFGVEAYLLERNNGDK